MKYKVGSQTLRFDDPSRAHWAGQGARPMWLDVWYPTVDGVDEQVCHDPAGFFFISGVALSAPLLPERRPLIVLSHGTGGSGWQMGWLARALAAQGFIVAAVSHHGNTSIEPYLPQGFLLWWERATDLSRVLDFMLAHPEFAARIDVERIAVAGFSLGGYTALLIAGARCRLAALERFCASDARDCVCDGPPEFPELLAVHAQLMRSDADFLQAVARHSLSYKDSRIRAAFVMNPAPGQAFTTEGLAHINIPLHIVVTAGDLIVPPNTNGVYLASQFPKAELSVLAGAMNHYVYLCEATEAGTQCLPELCMDDPSVDRHLIHQQTAQLAVDFFERHC